MRSVIYSMAGFMLACAMGLSARGAIVSYDGFELPVLSENTSRMYSSSYQGRDGFRWTPAAGAKMYVTHDFRYEETGNYDQPYPAAPVFGTQAATGVRGDVPWTQTVGDHVTGSAHTADFLTLVLNDTATLEELFFATTTDDLDQWVGIITPGEEGTFEVRFVATMYDANGNSLGVLVTNRTRVLFVADGEAGGRTNWRSIDLSAMTDEVASIGFSLTATWSGLTGIEDPLQELNDHIKGLALDYRSSSQEVVPEPGTYAMLAGLGLVGAAWYRRRKNAADLHS